MVRRVWLNSRTRFLFKIYAQKFAGSKKVHIFVPINQKIKQKNGESVFQCLGIFG